MDATSVSAQSAPDYGMREVLITRVFDAPCSTVFHAWTDPKHLTRWWGPRGFTNPVCEFDARVGGAVRIVMRGPDGADYPMIGEVLDVDEPKLLVFTGIAVDSEGNHLLEGVTRVLFEDIGGKTKLTMATRAVAKVPMATAFLAGMDAGWTQSIEKLGEFLAGS